MKHAWSKYKWWILILSAVVIIIAAWFYRRSEILHSMHIVKRGTFEKIIESKGEIRGKNSIKIMLSEIFKDREVQIWEINIKDLVPEGTIVKKGDWVATLDQVNINQRIQLNMEELDRTAVQLEDAKIDSAVELSDLRQRIRELEFDLQYRALEVEQSAYESPAYQRRVKTAYNQTVRLIDRRKRDYELRRKQLEERTGRWEDYSERLNSIDRKLNQALAATNITAPEAGMIIYARTRSRGRIERKIRVGDQVGPWRPVIATLPDLAELISETYVEEIDIAKISKGDSAVILVDAIPDARFQGVITEIANVGFELSGFDSKVFTVMIELIQKNTGLLPGMTSNNQIIIERMNDQIQIPRKCLFVEKQDTFVYQKKEGKIMKKRVKTGPENDEMVIIKVGLNEKDRLLLEPPEDAKYIGFHN